ncbi:flagellar basal body L-ring protein FlgH [Chitiniphilus purpureus]|uniref:Flagellar L-ring protein n=1 Tax=Chitiniphilus purpureus TaxID=2981137 RepID=A0ABY6DUW5_9NEIS|nr:flagellar basal body L-ring protein FlgH [Chitiniphilus sp. CD1]UXY17306.1 flagellar basal body L-ring protein FlgH [Chitiniphilus sp. CD1]
MKHLGVALLAALLTACAMEPKSIVTQPTTTRPTAPLQASQNQGAIFQAGSARMLLEERVARHIGDLLTINVQENLSATNTSNSSADRTGELNYGTSGNLPFIPPSIEKYLVRPVEVTANSNNTFSGKGSTTNSNNFAGTIAVTVVDVLPNGNLVVGGDRQIAVNGQVNTLRFTGVVNPFDIQTGNTVSSTKVADARIEQVGRGYIADAQTMGWLQRFFLNVMPF